ncbi:MAG TPA: HD domain-containing protein, partial [Rhodanobacteraceae bacterium]
TTDTCDSDTGVIEARSLIATHALGAFTGEVVTGQYTLTQSVARTTRDGHPLRALTLVDATGSITVYAWEYDGLLPCIPIQTPTAVQAELYVSSLDGRTVASLRAIRALDVHEVANAAALLSLDACPERARSALAKLVRFVATLQPPVLRGFLNRVLFDPRVAAGFMTCKGSLQHHHAYRGGLLVHSVEALEIVTAMAQSRLDPIELAITQVAALLHDLGKLRAIGPGTVRPMHYRLASHESQTVRLLDPSLEWLWVRDREMAAGLNSIFAYIQEPAATRGKADFLGAQLVVYADRTSAAFDDHRRLADLLARTLPGRCGPARRPSRPRQASALL